MIDGFENETHDLTDYELKTLLPIISTKIQLNKGPDNAVTSQHVITVLKGVGHRTTGPRLRKMINVIRRTGKVRNLVASSKGYYVAIDKEDAKRFIDSLREREEAIRAVRLAMEEQRKYLL
jgi:hypothetical protein